MDGWLDAVAPAVWLAALVVLGVGMYRGLQALAGRVTQGVEPWALMWHQRCAAPERLAAWETSGDVVAARCLADFARGANLAEAVQVRSEEHTSELQSH